uniref:Serine/threonine-protein kinase ATM n=1 Tax=Anopheles epiroticus TaxID=199890 RepID=A0A182P1P5_9DIPT
MIAATFRACTNTAARTCSKSNILLQLLIRHRKYPSVSFLNGTVLEAFYTYAVEKTNLNVGTVLAILETVGNVECLGSVDGVLTKLLNYLYPQTRETKSKAILHVKERLNAKTLAAISILCVVTTRAVSDTEQQNTVGMGGSFYRERDGQLQTLEQNLRQHNIEELLVLEECKREGNALDSTTQRFLYNINEPLFERLCEVTRIDKHILPEDNDFLADALICICCDLELYLEMLNTLLLHEAYDDHQCTRSPLYKRVLLKFDSLNKGFERLGQNDTSLDPIKTKNLAERLLAVFRGPYHVEVKKLLRHTEHTLVMRWIMQQINLMEGEDSQYVTVLVEDKLSSEEQLQRCFYHIVAEYLQYSGPCMSEVHDLLDRLELNVFSNLDLFYLFELCHILFRQPSHENVAEWVLRNLVDVCKNHYTNPHITEKIIEQYGDLTTFVSPYEDMVRNVTIMLYSFVKQCAKHTYSTELQVKIFAQVKYLLRAYPQHVRTPMHEGIYNGLVPLMSSSAASYRIKLEAVKNILHFMQLDWSHSDVTAVSCSFYEFQRHLYDQIKFNELLAGDMDADERMNVISCFLQLLFGICRISFMLRRRALCDFVLFMHAGNVNDDKIANTIRQARASSDMDFSKLLQANLEIVLEQWLTQGYRLLQFPYRIAGKIATIEEFVQLFKKQISFVILCMQPERFEQFCKTIGVQQTEMVKSLLPKCVSFLLPKYAKCEGMVARYGAMAGRMHKALAPFLNTVDLKEYVAEIIKHLTHRLNDHAELGKLLEQDFPSCFVDDLSICKATYSKALEHLKQSVWGSQSFKYALLSNLCLKNSSPIERTLTDVKRWLWATEEPEQKAIHLLQYTVLLDLLKEYITQQKERSFKPYLVRDVVYFLSNLLSSFPALRLATLNALGRFLEQVLVSNDACELLSDHLHFIVSSLLEIEIINPSSELSQKALSLLKVMIVQHSNAFAGAIGKLNYLPKDERFDELRLAISRQKSAGHEHVQPREEIAALIELPNLRYEDLAALKIVVNNSKEAIERCADVLLSELNGLLTSKNITVCHFASQVCYKMLSSEEIKLFTRIPGRDLAFKAILANERIECSTFVQQLAVALLSFLGNTMLRKLVEQETSFAEKIIPLLVQITIKQFEEPILDSIGSFFKIAIIYLPIAQASQFCQAHFKAILYGELWYREEEEKGITDAKRHPDLLNIMKSSHLAIGVNDAVQSFLNPIQERMEYYRLEQNYAQCLVMQDAGAAWHQPENTAQFNGILQTLKDSSLYGLAHALNEPKQIDYECAWRLSDWNVVIDSDGGADGRKSETPGSSRLRLQLRSFERAHYKALKCLHLRDELAVQSAVTEAQRAVSEIFKLTSIESTKHIYHGLCRLRMMQQIEDFGEIHFSKQIDCEQDMLERWREQDELPHSEFSLLETILSQRLSIFNTAGIRAKRKWIPPAVYSTLLLLIHESRLRGFVDCAIRNVVLIGKLELPANVQSVVMLENALLNWSSGQRALAQELAWKVMNSAQYNDVMVKAVACRLYGEFLAEGHSQEIKSLTTDYFKVAQKCVNYVMSPKDGEQKTSSGNVPLSHRCFDMDRNYTVLHTVAKYADREFVRLTKFCRSLEWDARKTNIVKMKQEQAHLSEEKQRATGQRRKDLTRSLHVMQLNLERDKKAANEVEHNRSDYLNLALCYYLLYANQSTIVSDMVIFRIMSLWLNNQENSTAKQLIEDSLLSIPSYKFIAVLPQLTPRVGLDKDVGTLVQQALIRCALDHPHHTLPFVFAQLHAFKDQPDHETPTNDNRLQGIREVYKKLQNEPVLQKMLQQMERMNLALIELANKTLSSSPTFREYTMTKRDALGQLENLDLIHCPTVELPVLKDSKYCTRIVGIKRWDAKVIGVGGINAPKKLTCLCLNGTKRTQLLKGKDDMRQDAVMQQVFGIMNILLRQDKETAHRKLSVRTYRVVPLSRLSGILEWCNNTMPIGAWLLTGHTKYRPQDMQPSAARKKFSDDAKCMTFSMKLKNYEEICDKIRPVFRHYFLEQYLKPGVWFERQQNYIKSVAASSMIGYVLGIGDRHVQNILIDKLTAEVIHIDFGIAFEMGKNLPTPETVPFRLTRDLVDGMGISGVEGVFRKSCVKTLEVLRNNQTVILAILEVLLYDPLYSWNVLANKKATRRQQQAFLSPSGDDEGDGGNAEGLSMGGADINVTAERTLMQVEEKLLGQEDNRYISVEGQVQMLIFNATNKRNLCQLFSGWQPYL